MDLHNALVSLIVGFSTGVLIGNFIFLIALLIMRLRRSSDGRD